MVFHFLDTHHKNFLTKEDFQFDIDKFHYDVSLDDIEELIDTYVIENKRIITFELFKHIMKEDIKLQKCNKGIGTLITRRLSKQLSFKEMDF